MTPFFNVNSFAKHDSMLNTSCTLRQDYIGKKIIATLNSNIASMMIVTKMNWTLKSAPRSTKAVVLVVKPPKLLELRILRELVVTSSAPLALKLGARR